MEQKSETKKCANCKNEFIIGSDDFGFYEKIKVPPPTWCPECRLQRKMTWRNERSLYKRVCGMCKKNIIAMYSDANDFPVYCQECWWGDGWDPLSYGIEYNFSKSFFSNVISLFGQVPQFSLFNLYSHNSEYCNGTFQSKNCYLNFASDVNEDTAYLYHSIENRNCYDMLGSRKNEQCFELIDCERCYESEYLVLSEECINSKYCYDCRSCQNCIGCFGLRNKKYQILNKQYTEEGYKKELESIELSSFSGRKEFQKKFEELLKKYPRKFINSRLAVKSTGNYLNHLKNCLNCFDIEGPAEDLKYLVYGVTNLKNIYDCYAVGFGLEMAYESLAAGDGLHNSSFNCYVWSGFDNYYSFLLKNCSHCFACIGLRSKQYCILNKQYTKEEYESLIPKIIKHMSDMPYIDAKGRIYKYGEFFPPELSPFCYNETIAQEYFPLTKEQALNQGYKWKDKEARNYTIDIKNEDIPNDIKDVTDNIVGKVIECAHKDCNHQCTEAFKIIPEELSFYKRMNLPLPRLCPNCRHYARLAQRNPLKLWHRKCMHEGCNNEFETSYAPERPEIVYCESCYNKEVY